MSGVERIAAERRRQVEHEGWTPDHDDEHSEFELTRAAIGYAMFSLWQSFEDEAVPYDEVPYEIEWPWDPEWWKPSRDIVRNLEKAGALIAAEIDRLERLNEQV